VPVKTKTQVVRRIRTLARELQALGSQRLGLFGSFVRREPTPDSDVDLLTHFAPGQKTFNS
jgi:uncharacterized protein